VKLFAENQGFNNLGLPQQAQKKQAQQILILSDTPDVIEEVSAYLSINNINDHRVCEDNFFSLKDNAVIGSARSVIIDIADETDLEVIAKRATLLIPNIVRVIFLGNVDSISFSQSMKRAGFHYLHRKYELQNIAALLTMSDSSNTAANLMKISVLGCKGGIGTTTVSYNLFKSLTHLSTIPTLLVQGNSGSSDLDLIMEQVIPRDGSISYVANHAAVRLETAENSWSFNDAMFNRFNLIIFEHSMVGSINDKLESIFANSQTIILVLNRNLTCLRVAKRLIEEQKRNFISRPVVGQKIIICLNENTPNKIDDMKNEDIEEYLQCRVSLILPYTNKKHKQLEESPVYGFARHHILGLGDEAEVKSKRFYFGKILGK